MLGGGVVGGVAGYFLGGKNPAGAIGGAGIGVAVGTVLGNEICDTHGAAPAVTPAVPAGTPAAPAPAAPAATPDAGSDEPVDEGEYIGEVDDPDFVNHDGSMPTDDSSGGGTPRSNSMSGAGGGTPRSNVAEVGKANTALTAALLSSVLSRTMIM